MDYLRDSMRGKNVVAARNRQRQIRLTIAITRDLAQDSISIGDVFDRGRAIIMSTGSDGKTSWRARKPDGLHGVSDSPNVQITK
jgi:hypothetical protein